MSQNSIVSLPVHPAAPPAATSQRVPAPGAAPATPFPPDSGWEHPTADVAREHDPATMVRRYTPAAPAQPYDQRAHAPSASGLPGPAAPVFLPVVDLDTGGAVAVEVISEGASYGGPGMASTVNGLLAAAREEALLPLVLPISAAAVAGGSAGLASLHEAMRVCNRRPREVILVIEGGSASVERTALLSGIDGLRAVGYLIAFGGIGTAALPLDLLADASPYMIALSPDVVARGPRDPRRGALAESLVRLARGVGAHVLAPGVRDETQLAAVRGWGIRLAQGPLLAPFDWRPSHGYNRVHVPLPVPEATAATASLGPRVQELLLPAVTLPAESTAEEVVAVLSAEPSITSVILVDEYQRPQGSIDRSRFLLFMAGAYGHALHAKKAAGRLADTAKIVAKTTPVIAAMQVAGRDNTRVYDDLVVVDEVGRCMGVVRVGDLLRHAADLQSRSAR
ncbi:EAL domain, c-di-GMP-specific phosphodiesterase class I (or its enzymatically inactive variant) [Microbispora rosea]|uniref:EAL domain, c-di-GMP-specific phosphodiesterase class I (Or its enzymatically inactive variant) n=1 Tax=Microbispora rosea TaxID=58117 RepID=A0A1N7GYE1_9ACTN|nr:EAL domain, c-di-GMP-specific phosphodiesterase class I (or its enzymatically inactive variant) [Microbispora rosea]